MAGPKTRSVSLEGDSIYVQALGAIAKKRNITIGKLVRETVDAALSDELAPLVSFFAQDGNQINQIKEQDTNQ